jgi:hypothetical protein
MNDESEHKNPHLLTISLAFIPFFQLHFGVLLQATCKCAFSCKAISLEYRKQLFEEFYNLGDYSKQQQYLQRLIHPQLIKRRRYGKYDHPSKS